MNFSQGGGGGIYTVVVIWFLGNNVHGKSELCEIIAYHWES